MALDSQIIRSETTSNPILFQLCNGYASNKLLSFIQVFRASLQRRTKDLRRQHTQIGYRVQDSANGIDRTLYSSATHSEVEQFELY